MRSRSARFDRVISSSHEMAVRVDVLYGGRVIIGGEGQPGLNIVSGDVTYDRTAAILARCQLKVAEPTRLPTLTDGGPMSPYGYELQVWRGINYADGTQELMSLGVFPIQHSSFDGVSLAGDIECLDRAKRVQDAKFEQDYPVAAGTNTGTAISALINAGVPGLEYAFETTPYTTPSVVFPAGSDRWDAARALAKSVGCEVYFDGYGRCVMRSEPGVQSTPVLVVAEGGTLTAVTLDLDREPMFNRVIVTGSNSASPTVYRGVATDDNPASPTFYDGPAGRKAMFFSSPHIGSDEQATAVAGALLTAVAGVARSLNLSMVPNPALEPGDVIQTTRSTLGIDELYILDGFTIGLTADAVLGIAGADIWVGSQVMRARFVQAVTADAPIDPEDPGGSLLVDEGFDGGQDGDTIDIGGITADSIGGTLGTLTHSEEWQLEGGYSLKIAGTAAETARWEHASHDEHYTQFYYRHSGLPGENAYICYLYAADGTTVALRIGITAAGLVRLQDSTTGSGGGLATSTALTIDQFYRFDLTAGHGDATLSIYDTATINGTGTTGDWQTLTITLTATAFSDEVIGLINTLASGGTEVSGNLVNEDFEGAANTDPASAATTTADTGSGAGTLTHSTTYAAEGTRSLRVNGTVNQTLRWDKVSRANTYISFYMRFVTPPGTTHAYLVQARTGDDATVAFQFGVQTDGMIRIRDANNGTGAALDTATAALTTNTNYRVDISALGAGDLTLRYYTGANIDSTNTANAVETMTCTLAATTFADIQLGLIVSVTTAPNIFIDRFKVDNTALPTPLGVTAGGTPLEGFIERFKSDSMTMPTPLDIDVEPPPPPPPGGKLVPASGAWWGSSTPVSGGKGTSEPGLAEYLTATGNRRPHILHFFIASWNGLFSAAQKRMLAPGGGVAPAIPLVNWKPGSSVATVANGGANSELDTAFDNMSAHPHQIFVTCWHEHDIDIAGDNAQAATYVNMFRYVVDRYRTRILPARRNVIWVWAPTGYRTRGVTGDFDEQYPGDDVIDWIAYDPYGHEPDDDFAAVVNDPTGAWTGYYNWATAQKTLAASGSRPTNFSGGKPIMMAEFGVDLNSAGNGKTDAAAAAVFDSIPLQAPDYPQLKAVVYWNGRTVNGQYEIQRSGYTQVRTAVRALLDDDYFTQDTSTVA